MIAIRKSRPILTCEEVFEGVTLRSDDCFTCLLDGQISTVCRDGAGLYVGCDLGKHYLDGQYCDKDGAHSTKTHYLGFTKVLQ
jgi:hypothetical protein